MQQVMKSLRNHLALQQSQAPIGDSSAWYKKHRHDCAVEANLNAKQEQKITAANRIKSVMGGAGIPGWARDVKFSTLHAEHDEQLAVINAVRRYTKRLVNRENTGENLILIGGPGVGKTSIAAALANTAIEYGMSVLWVTMPDLIRQARDAVSGRCEMSELDILTSLALPDVLVIDEFGRHQASEFNRDFVWRLIFKRHEAAKPMVCTSNLIVSELERVLDPAALSRLSDRGSLLLQCSWKSYRGTR